MFSCGFDPFLMQFLATYPHRSDDDIRLSPLLYAASAGLAIFAAVVLVTLVPGGIDQR